MRPLIILLAISTVFCACREVSYPVAQPNGKKNLTEVPKKLVGKYLQVDSGTVQTMDTLIVESKGYRFSTKEKENDGWLDHALLSDSLVLKSSGGYYFFNFKINDQWILRVIKQSPTGDVQIMSIELGENTEGIISKISEKLKVQKIEIEGDTFYQINPTSAQLMALIKDGFFTGDLFKKIE